MARLEDLHADKPWTITKGSPAYRADQLADAALQDPSKAGPDDPSPEALAWRDRSVECRNLLAGNPTPHLIQWEGETDAEFGARKRNSTPSFVNFYEEAVGGLVDKVFSRPLQLGRVQADDGSPADNLSDEDWQKVLAFWDNVCQRKRTPEDGSAFAREACQLSLGKGGTPAILIDYPTQNKEFETAAEERESGIGPYLVLIDPERILAADENEEGDLEHFRFVSSRRVRFEWATRDIPIIVVLERGEPGRFATRRELVYDEDKKEYIEDESAFRELAPPETASAQVRARFREIPIVDLPTGSGEWFADPVLRNVALLNVLHYRKRTDFDVAESVASVPMAAFFGVSEGDMQRLQWGPYRVFWTNKTPQEVEHKDISFGFTTAQTSLKTLESIERYIAIKSKDPQSQRATGEEKSTIRLLDEAKRISRLQAWALGWLQSFQSALQWAGWWMGLEEVGVLSYLDEVFEALDSRPTWSDYRDFMATLLELPEAAWPVSIREAKRYGVLSDQENADKLIEDLSQALPTESGVGWDFGATVGEVVDGTGRGGRR